MKHLHHPQATHRPRPCLHRRLQPAISSSSSRRSLRCHASVVWRQLDRSKAWLTHPRSARTKGVVHFIGGAFAGAAPQLLYNSFIELLADAGWTVISTPYKVTFQHDVCAREVRQAFLDSLAELRSTGRSYLAPPHAPQFGVGHSNGALLQLLINSYEPGATDANVIISYNNLQVSDAIPIPGFLDTLQPTVQAARAAGDSSSTSSTQGAGSSSSQQQLLAAAAASLPLAEQQQLLLAGAAPALEQLSSIANEVGDGLTDFRPSPQESRAIIRAGYACPATLLVQFENDNFDETPEMQTLLAERQAGTAAAAEPAAAAAAADGGVIASAASASSSSRSLSQSGFTSAWNSIDEDVSLDNLLQQLQELQGSLQQQEQQREQQQQQGLPQLQLQQMLLPGSHITPCGADLQVAALAPAPLSDFLAAPSNSGSPAELKTLVQQVLGFLDGRRPRAVQRRAGMMQQQQQPQQAKEMSPAAATQPEAAADPQAAGAEEESAAVGVVVAAAAVAADASPASS